MDGCIFCQIAAGKANASVKHETENIICFDSINPVAKHHILIVPKVHIESFDAISSDNKGLIIDMVESAQQLIKDLKLGHGYKLVFNGGVYQAIPHLHWHLLAGKLENESDILNKT